MTCRRGALTARRSAPFLLPSSAPGLPRLPALGVSSVSTASPAQRTTSPFDQTGVIANEKSPCDQTDSIAGFVSANLVKRAWLKGAIVGYDFCSMAEFSLAEDGQ